MRVLMTIAHPAPASLTHAVARQVSDGALAAGHKVDVADLMAEGFDPRFTATDLRATRGQAAPSEDILAYHRRIDMSDAILLVFPVYWWSMPALLKGWIDRVFIQGWAFDLTPEGRLSKKLSRLDVHMLGVGGADRGTYDRHGYLEAMRTQIDHGIFDYCGAKVVTSEILFESETADPTPCLRRAYELGDAIAAR